MGCFFEICCLSFDFDWILISRWKRRGVVEQTKLDIRSFAAPFSMHMHTWKIDIALVCVREGEMVCPFFFTELHFRIHQYLCLVQCDFWCVSKCTNEMFLSTNESPLLWSTSVQEPLCSGNERTQLVDISANDLGNKFAASWIELTFHQLKTSLLKNFNWEVYKFV